MSGKFVTFVPAQIAKLRSTLDKSNRPHSPSTPNTSDSTGSDLSWIKVSEVVDPATNPPTYKGSEVQEDGSDPLEANAYVFDSDAAPSGPEDIKIYLPDIEGLPEGIGDIEVGGIYRLVIIEDESDGSMSYYLEPKGGGGTSLRYFQVTDVDYTKNNDQNTSSFIYRGVEVASIDALPVPPPAEVDKQDIIIHTGYPWNLVIGDNLLVLQEFEGSGLIIAQNIVEPEPVIKVVSGSIEVWDKEVGGVSLTVVKPGYRIMSGPSVLLSTYDDLFLIAQWSKRSNLVRIYLPTI